MTLSILALMASLSPSAQAVESCYVDNDGDGYYASGAAKTSWTWYDWPAATDACGSRAEERFAFDCDDSDASVHPRRRELNNGIDDNCNGKVDEPTFNWPSGVSTYYNPSDTSLGIYVYVKDDDVLDRGDSHGDLVAKWSYRSIDDPTWSTTYQSAATISSSSTGKKFTLTGLDAGTVYAFKVQLGTGSGSSFQPIDEESDQYFSMTSDVGSDLGADVRTDIVVSALRNFYRSNAGFIGYEGTTTVDGTSNSSGSSGYGTARGGTNSGLEQWCTEAYVGHTEDFVDGAAYNYTIPTNGYGSFTNINTLANNWFDASGAPWEGTAYAGTACDSCSANTEAWAQFVLVYSAQPGDWVHLNGHSTMLLGYDSTNEQYWVVDGNGSFPTSDMGALTDPAADGSDSWQMASNVISVRAFPKSSVAGVGLLVPDMF